MTVFLFVEWDNPKGERLKEYYDKGSKLGTYWEKKQKEGLVKKINLLTDSCGHLIWIAELTDIDAYATLMKDQEYHFSLARLSRLVDNIKIRILTPAGQLPPD